MKALKQLEKMVGKTYLYHTSEIKINNYKHYGDKVLVITSKWNKDMNETQLTDFVKDCQSVNAEDALVAAAPVATVVNGQANDLMKILLEDIDKVQKDPAYINQSKAVNNSVKTILQLAKVQLDMVKTARGK